MTCRAKSTGVLTGTLLRFPGIFVPIAANRRQGAVPEFTTKGQLIATETDGAGASGY